MVVGRRLKGQLSASMMFDAALHNSKTSDVSWVRFAELQKSCRQGTAYTDLALAGGCVNDSPGSCRNAMCIVPHF